MNLNRFPHRGAGFFCADLNNYAGQIGRALPNIRLDICCRAAQLPVFKFNGYLANDVFCFVIPDWKIATGHINRFELACFHAERQNPIFGLPGQRILLVDSQIAPGMHIHNHQLWFNLREEFNAVAFDLIQGNRPDQRPRRQQQHQPGCPKTERQDRDVNTRQTADLAGVHGLVNIAVVNI